MKTVTLCGSTKFKEQFQLIERRLSFQGYAVYTCALWGHQDDPLTDEQKLTLDAVHMVKIANSDEIYVISQNGYFGESTRREIYFAAGMGKKITFMEPGYPFAREWTRK